VAGQTSAVPCRFARPMRRAEPANRETNYRTEFVVVLNNQPQGGLASLRMIILMAGASWVSSTRQRGGRSYYPGRQGSSWSTWDFPFPRRSLQPPTRSRCMSDSGFSRHSRLFRDLVACGEKQTLVRISAELLGSV
jgi:hypothetical protein